LAKPKLSNEYLAILQEGNYALQVEIKLHSSVDDERSRQVAHPICGSLQLQVWESETEDSQTVEVGHIVAWRTLSFHPQQLVLWADSIDQDVYSAFDWLVNQQTRIDPQEVLLHPALLLDRVIVEPEWRGLGFTLPAVATFLDMVACEFVFLMPSPTDASSLSKQELKRGRQRLKRYWQKLGFENYDAKHNVLWTEGWSCPEWLRANAF
jgi:hypothetical protein